MHASRTLATAAVLTALALMPTTGRAWFGQSPDASGNVVVSQTQMNNANYPALSPNPDCAKSYTFTYNGTTMTHGPCVAWPIDHTGQWCYSHTGSADARTRDWHDAVSRAVGAWNDQPYRNPLFTEGPHCNLMVTEAVLAQQPGYSRPVCGVTNVTTDPNDSTVITQATVTLNLDSQIAWYDNQSTESSQLPAGYSGAACDLAGVLLHETGHGQGLGHSQNGDDVMFWQGTPYCGNDGACVWVESIDGDASQSLHVIYGDLPQQSSSGGGGGGYDCNPTARLGVDCHNSPDGELPGNPLNPSYPGIALDWAAWKAENYPGQFTPLPPAPPAPDPSRLPNPLQAPCRPECPPASAPRAIPLGNPPVPLPKEVPWPL
jgi:hypothetical protein